MITIVILLYVTVLAVVCFWLPMRALNRHVNHISLALAELAVDDDEDDDTSSSNKCCEQALPNQPAIVINKPLVITKTSPCYDNQPNMGT
jgi:hypothetical protein